MIAAVTAQHKKVDSADETAAAIYEEAGRLLDAGTRGHVEGLVGKGQATSGNV
jgi:hypothetical protein